MNEEKPLLLLDIDGVIGIFGPEPADGCLELVERDIEYLTVAASTPGHLATLSSHFELAWATSWEHTANESLAAALGLPPLPVVELDDDHAPGESLKLAPIIRFVGDRPFAWVDDEIGNDAKAWSEARGTPCLMLEIDSRWGLDEDAVGELIEFARSI